jgi:hypothetical protein
VEQQGRLTLHLHFLLWVVNALSPQEIREKFIDPNSRFRKSLIVYLESCHQGEFFGGSKDDVQTYLKVPPTIEDDQDRDETNIFSSPTQSGT